MNDDACPDIATVTLLAGPHRGQVINCQHGGSFTIGGIVVRVFITDDGTRIVHAEDVEQLLSALRAGLKLCDDDNATMRRLGAGQAPHG